MIKVVGLLTRKPGMSHEAFVRHWSDIHGPLAHAVPGIRRYVQSHIVDTRTRPDIPETEVEIDGIAELWYDDLESLRIAGTRQATRVPALKAKAGTRSSGRRTRYCAALLICTAS